jgi:23S rRNA pseudouridine1911/1915/1917 synthase
MKPTIIYEDNHILAVNKPAGWLVQGDQTGDETLTDWAKAYIKVQYNKPGAVYLHPVHRIDRPVSGAVLFARTEKALGRLNDLFKNRKVDKTYLAIVLKAPVEATGTLRHFLLKDEQKNLVKAFLLPRADAKESITEYKLMERTGSEHYLLKVNPLTGRSHQIRVQLAEMGCIILGDLKYGAGEPLPDASIALHCRSMSFVHPVQQVVVNIEAPLPEQNWWG